VAGARVAEAEVTGHFINYIFSLKGHTLPYLVFLFI